MTKLVFAMLLLHLVFTQLGNSWNPIGNADVLGLIVFKADIFDPEGRLVSWNEDDDSPCNNWVGIKCDRRSNRVSELVLDGFALSGKIGRGLLQLQFLRKLQLAKNNLTGPVNPSFTRLENLHFLDLSENSLSGTIPGELFQQCGSLRSISLARNKFTGTVPETLGSCSTLVSLDFSGNRLSGPLPFKILSLKGLRSIDLSDNLLEGQIPIGFEKLTNLRAISLRGNKFTGSIPDGIGKCSLLRSLDFSENSLSGTLPSTFRFLTLCNNLNIRRNAYLGEVPEWIGEMRSLEVLDLSSNSFYGTVPDSIGNLWSLKVLNLSTNGFTGSLPEPMINCKSLLVVDFSHNALTGGFPVWILTTGVQEVLFSGNKLSGNLEETFPVESLDQKLIVLDLSRNEFSGLIPSGVGDFSSLRVLNLSVNLFNGNIPASLGKLKVLDILDLSENWLDGNIPTEIGDAVHLNILKLEKNSLAGTIPTSIENCSSLNSLILASNNISGSVPVALAKLTNLQAVDLSFNKLTGTLPKQLANLNRLVSFNVSHNDLEGELPTGGFFNTIPPSSLSGNPSLCGAVVDKDCPTYLPKPIVLNPNPTGYAPGSVPQTLTHKKIILSISALVAIGAAALIVIGVIFITVLNFRVRSYTSRKAAELASSGGEGFSQSPDTTTEPGSGKLVMFSGDHEFSTGGAHALLSKDCELGRGGFGAVYRTALKDGRSVAVKKLTVSSLVKSQDDFEREVKTLGKISHPNLVSLQGYYWTPSLQLLIYEYVSGGSLYKHLHEGYNGNFLSWNDRLNVILGMANSLAHLHRMDIIHYNLKSSNVLIDGCGEAKVADSGLARLLPMLDRYVLSSKIQSALGYMAPEFACRTVKVTDKCDVYGFGVLVLEIVTGKKPVEYMEDDVVVLCDVVRGALEEDRVEECVDLRLEGSFPADVAIPVMKLGLVCTSQVPSNRPDMGEVVNILELIRCPSEGQEELV